MISATCSDESEGIKRRPHNVLEEELLSDAMIKYAISYTQSYRALSVQDREDVAQEALTKAHNSLHKFKGHAKLLTWFTTILKNTALDRIKKKNREIEAMTVFGELHPNSPEADTQYTDDGSTSLEEEQVLPLDETTDNSYIKVKEILSDRPKLLELIKLQLKCNFSLSHKELAEILGTKEVAVRKNWQRIRVLLQPLMDSPKEHQSEDEQNG